MVVLECRWVPEVTLPSGHVRACDADGRIELREEDGVTPPAGSDAQSAAPAAGRAGGDGGAWRMLLATS